MSSANYWSIFLHRKLLSNYSLVKASPFAIENGQHFKKQILQNYKNQVSADFALGSADISFSLLKAKPVLIKFIAPILLKVSVIDLVISRLYQKPKIAQFLFPAPQIYYDFCFTSNDTSVVSFLYLLPQAVLCISRIQNVVIMYLGGWLTGEGRSCVQLLLALFSKQNALLTMFSSLLLKRNFLFQFSPVVYPNKIPKPRRIVKKKPKKINYLTPDVMQFLLNLIKISSRGGVRLRNFKHFVLFLTKLRRVGGYATLARAIRVLNPYFYFRKSYRGRKRYYIPFVIIPTLRYKYIGRSILNSVLQRKTERAFSNRLIMEILDAVRRRGQTYRYKNYTINFAKQNKFNVRKLRSRRRFFKRRIFY